jgi:hypothetical protein
MRLDIDDVILEIDYESLGPGVPCQVYFMVDGNRHSAQDLVQKELDANALVPTEEPTKA